MKRKNLKLSSMIILVSALTVLSSCETSARYIGSNSWEGSVSQIYHDSSEWYGLSQSDVEGDSFWNIMNGYNGYTKIYLKEDITLTASNYAIWIQNPGITLCLHGHTINAYSEAGTNETEGVISIKDSSDGSTHGSLTLEDCMGGGKITGGNDVYNESWASGGSGGGISVNGSDCSLIMNGGIIEGNSTQYQGGGIYNYAGYVEINGGTIKNNTAGEEGGGIYNDKGKLVINGGQISGNNAIDGGGIYSDCDPADENQGLYINGGTITGNTAETDAGGIKFEHYVESEEDETVYQETESTLHLSGNPYIYDNYAIQNEKSIQYNVETDELSLLAFDGVLSDGALIGVTYSGKKAEKDPPYQISVADSSTYTQSAVNYIVSDVEYYETKYNETGKYLELDGVSGYNEVTTTSITLTFEFTYTSEVSPTSTNGNKIILPTTKDGEQYARIFIEGSWDNYETEHNLTLDEDTDTYYVTLTDLTINYHSFYIYVGYLDNDDHIPLSDDNPQFTFMVPLDVDSKAEEGVYNIGFSVSCENEFSDLVSEDEDVHKVNFTLQFQLWQGWESDEQQPLEYGDLYVWTSMNDWSGWMKCYVMEDEWDAGGNATSSHYYLDVDNLEENTYEYSLVIWYNDEEIPDPEEDDSVWDRKVNKGTEGDSGTNNIFTVTDAILAENDEYGYIPIALDDSYDLDSLLPFRLTNYTFTFTLYSTDTTIATCPDYGSLYLIGDFRQEDNWEEYELLTYDEGSGTYSVTVPEVYPGIFEYNILFVYDDEDGPSSSSWTHALFSDDQTYTIEKEQGNGYIATITHTLGFELGTKFAEHGDALTNYTLRFTIWTSDNANQGRDYSTYGYNVYIIGSFTGSDWTTAEICIYNSHYSEVYGEEVVSFDFTTDNVFQAGDTYTYKLLYTNTTVDSYTEDWTNPQITEADQYLTVPADAKNDEIYEIEIKSDIWFNNPYKN